MMVLTNVRVLAALITIAVLSVGCGSGLSTEEATQRCDQERFIKDDFYTDSSYAQCISCFEECGDECLARATAPETYACPEE